MENGKTKFLDYKTPVNLQIKDRKYFWNQPE